MSLLKKNKNQEQNKKKTALKDWNSTQNYADVDVGDEVKTFQTGIPVEENAEMLDVNLDASSDEGASPVSADELIKQLEAELDQERDKRLRLLAEYDNYRRRTQSEYRHIIQQSNERLILNLLPVLDDFKRYFEQDSGDIDSKNVLSGVTLISRKLLDVLVAEGLKPIDSLGEEFNAESHDAIAQVEDNDKPEGIILVEVEKGFQLGDKIIRHPKVVVNRKSECEIEAQDE